MYVYREFPNWCTVGFYSPDGEWHPESDYDSKDEAVERVNYLNGGSITTTSCNCGCPFRDIE